MILSSSDILRVLSADTIIRQEATVSVVDGRPGLGTEDTVYIYIEKYPTIDEFEAIWKIWVQDVSGMGEYVLNAMTSLLPNFDFKGDHYTTTDFASSRTVVKTQEEIDREEFQDRFSGLQKGLEDRLSTVRDGRDGKDGRDGTDGLPGKDGRDGIDGRDGRDLLATDAELFDLQDVEQSVLPMEKGQVLTWDGGKWTNLYVAQFSSSGGGSGSGNSSVQVLDDLTDVNAPTPNNGDMIAYNSASGLWEKTAAPPADISGNSIGDLGDVTIDPGLLEKDFGLVYDGSEWVVASPPVLIEGHNQTGSTLLKGTPVYVAGTHNSGKPLLANADADGAGTYPAIGLLHEDLTDGSDGHVMLSGILSNVDTSGYFAGDALYLSTTPGALTNVRPTAVTEKVQKVGLVTRAHATAGSILIIGAGRTNDINNELVALIGAGDKDAVDLGVFAGNTINDNVDIKTALSQLEAVIDTALQPGDNISELTNDAGYITIADVPSSPVTSVAGKTGDVTLVKTDITDFSDADYATAAQGLLADTALQPSDNISELNNDAGYITDAGVTQIVAGDNITIDPAGGAGVVTINSTSSGDVEEAPLDGNYYVRASGAWVKLVDALAALGVEFNEPIDGGNFTTGGSIAITNTVLDAGNFTNGATAAINDDVVDGGNFTTGQTGHLPA